MLERTVGVRLTKMVFKEFEGGFLNQNLSIDSMFQSLNSLKHVLTMLERTFAVSDLSQL